MSKLTFDELRDCNLRRCEGSFHPLASWSANDWAVALAGEVGELCNLLKKSRRGETINRQDIADEIADVQTYLDLLAARLGIDLGHATAMKFNDVSDRVGSVIELPQEAVRGYDDVLAPEPPQVDAWMLMSHGPQHGPATHLDGIGMVVAGELTLMPEVFGSYDEAFERMQELVDASAGYSVLEVFGVEVKMGVTP